MSDPDRSADERAWIDAGLLDPDAPEAADRRELLRYLADLGVTIDEMLEAAHKRGIGTASSDQLLRVEGGLDLAGAATGAGISVELARRVFLATGFAIPDDEEMVFGAGDVHILAAFSGAMALFGEDPVLGFLRVVGSSLARIAESADAMFLTEVEGPLRASGSGSVEVARSARQGLELLLGLPAVMAPMFRHHVVAAVMRSRAARGGGLVDRFLMTVGFADLVGSTQLTSDVDATELGRALADFEREAADRATAHGARLVKAIGDEVMVAATDPVAVVDVLIGLAGYVRDHPVLTQVRAAAAIGELQGRGGDWFGPEVNIAARLVREASAGQVVVTDAVARAVAAAGRTTTPLGERTLRGVDEPVAAHLVGGAPTAEG